MAVVSGIDATISYPGGYFVNAKSWTLNVTAEDVDITALGDAWGGHLPGLRRWSGSYTCLVNTTAATATNDGAWPAATIAGTSDATLGQLAFGDTTAAATFSYASSGTVQSFSGNIIIMSFDVGAEVEGGGTEITFNFVGDGALSVAG